MNGPPWTSADWMNPDAQLAWENGSDGVNQYEYVDDQLDRDDLERGP